MSAAFEAKFDGYCRLGGHRIRQGDPVRYGEDDNLVHVDCTDQPAPVDENDPRRTERMCHDCNMVHAGGCDW